MDNIDDFAFNGGLGVEAKKENFAIDLNYNVQASKHATTQSIKANFRYEF